MHNALGGGHAHSLAHLPHPGQHFRFWERLVPGPQPLTQILAGHPVHDEQSPAIREQVEIMHGDDMRRFQTRQQFRLALKALGVGTEQTELDRHLPL